MKRVHCIVSRWTGQRRARGGRTGIAAGLLLVLALGPAGCRNDAGRSPDGAGERAAATRPSTGPATATATTARAQARASTRPTPPAERQAVSRFEPREAVAYLASDELEGRGVETEGLERAAAYIANVFRGLGLKPVPGREDLYQPFEITVASAVGPQTALRAGEKAYRAEREFVVASFSGEKAFEGDVVFAGYGIASPEHPYDDYAGVDVRGKVVLAMRFEPHDATGLSRWGKEQWTAEATLARKAAAAAERGAAALVLVNPPVHHEGDVLMPFARQFAGQRAQIPVVQVTQAVADEWLKRGAVKDLKALQKLIDEEGKPQSVELAGVRVSGRVEVERKAQTVKNVMAVLPARAARAGGPAADEYIVVGAHYDHLGYGGAGSLLPRQRAIHNGADDNASGTAGLLEIADRLAENGPLERSVLFVAFTAEERGLLGSAYFVNNPPVPLSKVVAMVNLDMVGRVRENVLYIGGAGTAAAFERFMREADEASPLELRTAGRGGYAPSDHLSFALKKIPVLFLWSGLHPDYHRPSDDAERINYDGLEQAAVLGAGLVRRIAAMEQRPAYVEVVGVAGATTAITDPHAAGVGGPTGRRVTLGVVPDYTQDESVSGARISGTVPGSPAAAAGLQDGDVIVGWGRGKVTSLYDLTDYINRAKAGEKVKLRIKRGGEEIEKDVTLVERRG